MEAGGDFHESSIAPKKAFQLYSEIESFLIFPEPNFKNERRATAKKMVKDLRLKTEQSNSRTKAQIDYLEKVKRDSKSSGDWGMNIKNHQSMEVMKELEDVKQELSKLKLDMASLLEDKRRAEEETGASKLKIISYSNSAETLRNEIDEINEEQVLADLARIEALKECAAIESERRQDSQKHYVAMEERREKLNRVAKEIEAVKDLETALAITMEDVNMLETARKQVKEMETVQNNLNILDAITKEIETTKIELASVREEGFRFMASMDIIRIELNNVTEEAVRIKRREERTELAIQSLNGKLLRARAKQEAASSAEEKAKLIVSSLSRTLEQYKIEAEAARKDGSLIKEETRKIKEEIDKTEFEIEATEEKLQIAIEELKSIKSSEARVLENLKTLTENTMRKRASASQHSSVITISNFEYEYLRHRASGAEEIADKKVAAAKAWIEALKSSERELLMKAEKARKEIRSQKLEGKKVADGTTKQSPPEKEVAETELDTWMKNYDKNTGAALTRRSSTMSGKTTPVRKGKHRVPVSPGNRSTSRSATLAARRRAKVMPNLAKLFSAKSDHNGNV